LKIAFILNSIKLSAFTSSSKERHVLSLFPR
ncbi:hypothetical protein T4A_1660, partial [Trichinella pseudospiralis]